MDAEYILKNSTICADTHTHILTPVETNKIVSKATQLHDKISFFKIHLSLFLAKSIIPSKNRPEVATCLQSLHSTSNFRVSANCFEKRIAKNRNLSTREKIFFERACIIFHSKRFSV